VFAVLSCLVQPTKAANIEMDGDAYTEKVGASKKSNDACWFWLLFRVLYVSCIIPCMNSATLMVPRGTVLLTSVRRHRTRTTHQPTSARLRPTTPRVSVVFKGRTRTTQHVFFYASPLGDCSPVKLGGGLRKSRCCETQTVAASILGVSSRLSATP